MSFGNALIDHTEVTNNQILPHKVDEDWDVFINVRNVKFAFLFDIDSHKKFTSKSQTQKQ